MYVLHHARTLLFRSLFYVFVFSSLGYRRRFRFRLVLLDVIFSVSVFCCFMSFLCFFAFRIPRLRHLSFWRVWTLFLLVVFSTKAPHHIAHFPSCITTCFRCARLEAAESLRISQTNTHSADTPECACVERRVLPRDGYSLVGVFPPNQ